MPVISAYSTSGSSYISPSVYRYKSSLTDRRNYTTSSSSSISSSIYRRGSYHYDLPSYSSAYPSYRSTDRTTDTELSSSLSTLATSTAKDTIKECSSSAQATATTVNQKDSSSSSRPSRFSTAYSSYSSLSSAPIRTDYSSRSSARSSDRRYTKDRDNNCVCAGGATASSSYVSNLRSTALSGADTYQKYGVSTYKPSSILAACTLKASSTSSPVDTSKATIKLRPSLNGTSAGTDGPRLVATVSTTDDLSDGECHVTATIRIKPKSSIITHTHTSSSTSSSSGHSSTNGSPTNANNNSVNGNNSNNNNNNLDDGESGNSSSSSSDDERDVPNGPSVNGIVNNNNETNGSSSINNGIDTTANIGANSVDKEPNKAIDDERVSYLRAGTASKSIHSTSHLGGYRSRDYEQPGFGSSLGSSYQPRLGSTSTLAKSSYNRSGNNDEPSSDSVRSSRKEGLCGLWNIGNTCFMNSVIQCLSHTRELTSFLRNQSSTERGTSKEHKILTEYTKLIKDMWSGTQRSVNPSELKYAFSNKHRMYSGSAQQDAQEFLRFFIDSLHIALNVSVKREPISRALEDDDLNNRIKATMMWEWYSTSENSVIKDLFVGLLRSTLKCTFCNGESVTFDPFWDLSLPLPSTNSRCKLENCLDMFVKEEVMDGIDQPTCSRCKTRRKCTKSLTIERFPKYLVIHLKRFSETRWSKLTNVIEFPTGERQLNLQPYASEDNTGPVYYSLYGISNHMGSTAGGHYIAACKHPVSKEWNEFNDNIVSETSERSLVTSSAYVLFYERA
ncbi:ubiquitin carboxyl-terminal hydrolase Usp2 isoform X3 [Toxorhynchites rutilus septentrionalis]|uniref:ubiquitin carboxyl-terminal hydrolase Usp2 isoform X3 n=1 Tax=Toxorhynchites rutilus septentrionalis TaxID=329112 RepID=UPI00247905A5|nr:ubiquitin carboxyl-terminal hydrolase Usp2 isoform X3 [Toxorhynchites rutilus septentrionalis]